MPKSDPIHYAANDAQLTQAIYARIAASNVVVIPTGMYAAHSDWIQKEIDGARLYTKPILAVDLRGAERKASVVLSVATEAVGWTKKSVVNAAYRLGA